MPSTHRISISVQALTPKLNPLVLCPDPTLSHREAPAGWARDYEPMSTSSLYKQTRDFDHAHSLSSMEQSALSVVIHPLRAQTAFLARNQPSKR